MSSIFQFHSEDTRHAFTLSYLKFTGLLQSVHCCLSLVSENSQPLSLQITFPHSLFICRTTNQHVLHIFTKSPPLTLSFVLSIFFCLCAIVWIISCSSFNSFLSCIVCCQACSLSLNSWWLYFSYKLFLFGSSNLHHMAVFPSLQVFSSSLIIFKNILNIVVL